MEMSGIDISGNGNFIRPISPLGESIQRVDEKYCIEPSCGLILLGLTLDI